MKAPMGNDLMNKLQQQIQKGAISFLKVRFDVTLPPVGGVGWPEVCFLRERRE